MVESTRYWFPAKRYGWGWGLPIAWQGWVVLVAFVVLLIVGIVFFPPTSDVAAFVMYVVVLTAALVVVCYLKGEPPAWRWGGK